MNTTTFMRPRRWLGLALSLGFELVALGPVAAQDTNFYIQSLSGNGVLTWTNHPQADSYKVQWAPTLAGPWSDSWESLTNIPATGAVYTAAVPMFYRLAAVLSTNLPTTPSALLIHGDGPDGSLAISDSAGHSLTRYGDTHISTSRSKFGGASIFFDGTEDYLTSPASPDWALGTNDFTVNLWVSFNAAPGTVHLIGQHTSGVSTEWSLVYEGGSLKFFISGRPVASTPWNPTLDVWYHLAATRAAGTLRLFIDGSLRDTVNNSEVIGGGRVLAIGAADNPGLFLNGYLDEIHISKGVALWTGNFTPPIAPYGY